MHSGRPVELGVVLILLICHFLGFSKDLVDIAFDLFLISHSPAKRNRVLLHAIRLQITEQKSHIFPSDHTITVEVVHPKSELDLVFKCASEKLGHDLHKV